MGTRFSFVLFALYANGVSALTTVEQAAPRTLTATDIMRWLAALLVVLLVFFACVWLMRKASGLGVGVSGQMRVLGGLSLGPKERLVLVQVGAKQLVLGITPGHIQTLHILEGEACVPAPQTAPVATQELNPFAQKLMQLMQGQAHSHD